MQIELIPGFRDPKTEAPMETVRQWSARMVGLLHRWRERPEVAALHPRRDLALSRALHPRRDLALSRALTVDEAIALGTEAINLRRKLSEAP